MSELKYDRQNRIPDWDQTKLADATVTVIGAGALGNHVCAGLMGLGIGTIKIYDYDIIEPHNLNRQSLFCESDITHSKSDTLARRLQERNSSIISVGIDEKITKDNIEQLIQKPSLLIDCVDRIYVRKILNYYCIKEDIPFIHGAISWRGGQVGLLTRETPCVNCIYPDEIQKEELTNENSCIRNPEASVVYVSQIISGLMVMYTRRALLPLNSDPPLNEGLWKLDFGLSSFLYQETIQRKANCECVKILKRVAPEIIKKEQKLQKIQQQKELEEITSIIARPTRK